VFPWQKKKCKSCSSCDGNGCSHCVNNGARTRKVCVLKPSSYKCPKCEYTWSAEKRDGCSGGCDSGQCACDAPAAAPKWEPTPVSPTPVTPAPVTPALENPTLENPTTENPTTENPTTENPTTENPTTEKASASPTLYGPARPSPLPRVGVLPPWLR
jgi:hypothetical protein